MKKILSLALIAALVLTCAFAGDPKFSGDATLGFNWDLKAKTAGFTNGTSAKVSMEWASDKPSKAGSADLRAEIAGEFTLQIKDTANDFSAAITKANIIYKDTITVGLLNAGGNFDFAKSYWTQGKPAKPVSVAAAADKYAPGYTVTYDKFTLGLGYTHGASSTATDQTDPAIVVLGSQAYEDKDGNPAVGDVTIIGTVAADDVVTPEEVKAVANLSTAAIEVAEGVKVQGAAQWKYNKKGALDAVNTIFAGAKADYANDDIKVSVGVDYVTDTKNNTVEFRADATAKPVTAIVYGSTKFKADTTDLNAKVTVADVEIAEDVKATCYADGRALLAEAKRSIEVGASASIKKVTVSASYGLAIKAKSNKVAADVAYGAEKFTAKAGAVYAFVAGNAAKDQLYFTASITSSKVVDGATLSLAYAANTNKAGESISNVLEGKAVAQNFGKITASAKVAF